MWMSNVLFKELLGMTNVTSTTKFLDSLKCPDTDPKAAGGPYGPNQYGFNRHGHGFSAKPLQFNRNRIAAMASKLQMVEGTDWHLDAYYADYVNRWDVYGQFKLWQVAYRHSEGANGLFFDGHVEYRPKEEYWFGGVTTQLDALWKINSEAAYK